MTKFHGGLDEGSYLFIQVLSANSNTLILYPAFLIENTTKQSHANDN